MNNNSDDKLYSLTNKYISNENWIKADKFIENATKYSLAILVVSFIIIVSFLLLV